jgi:hypothetical protein
MANDLRFTMNPVVALHHVDVFTMEEELERPT